MKQGFLNKHGARISAGNVTNSKTPFGSAVTAPHSDAVPVGSTDADDVIWSDEVTDAFLKACNTALDSRTRHDLERRIRSSIGSTAVHQHQGCGHGGAAHDHSHDDSADDVAKLIALHASQEGLRNAAAAIADRAQKVYFNVTQSAKKEGQHIGQAEDLEVRKEVLREALTRELFARILTALRKSHQAISHDGALLAIPGAYKEGPLDCLKPETIAALMKDGIAVQHGFIGEAMRRATLKELELLEFDGKYIDTYQQTTTQLQSSLSCWLEASEIDRIGQRGLFTLAHKLMSLPFEINKKASLLLQCSSMFHLSYFPASASYYKPHFDGGYGNDDTGRKITALYCPNPVDWDTTSDGGQFRVYGRRSKSQWEASTGTGTNKAASRGAYVDVAPCGDTLLLLRSRDMEYEVLECNRKRFCVCMWITGPIGPGDT